MKDLYYFRSLLVTVVVYAVILGLLTGFVVWSGPAGAVIISLAVIVLLAYFYSGT